MDDKTITYTESVEIYGSYNVLIAAYASAVNNILQRIIATAIKDGYEPLLDSVELRLLNYTKEKAQGIYEKVPDFVVIADVEAIKKEDTSNE